MPRFEAETNLAHNLELVGHVSGVAERAGLTAAQVAWAWVLSRGDDIIPIPGSGRITYLKDNSKAAEVVLPDAELRHLHAVFPPAAVAGARYDAEATCFLDE